MHGLPKQMFGSTEILWSNGFMPSKLSLFFLMILMVVRWVHPKLSQFFKNNLKSKTSDHLEPAAGKVYILDKFEVKKAELATCPDD
jgi:hypothetical protein